MGARNGGPDQWGDEHLQSTLSPCGRWWKWNAPTFWGKKNLLVAIVLEEEDCRGSLAHK